MYFLLVAVMTTAVAADTSKYCSLCRPGTSSGDRAHHTVCLYQGVGPACTEALDGGVTLEEQQLIVQEHNRWRSHVASGSETRGLPDGVPQPPAANMMALKWDEELGKVAQLWADQCIFRHDCRNVEDFKVGQNIAQFWNNAGPEVQWATAIGSWYDEVSNWSSADTPRFRLTGTEKMTAHYTQVVWAQSRFVGCGRRGFRRGPLYVQHYVCNYGPTGNYKGDPLYLAGAPCSLCPEDSECTGDVLCAAGAGALPDVYAHRYQHKPTQDATTTAVGLNVTSVPEDNELYLRYSSRDAYLEEAGKAFWDGRLRYERPQVGVRKAALTRRHAKWFCGEGRCLWK